MVSVMLVLAFVVLVVVLNELVVVEVVLIISVIGTGAIPVD